MGESQPAGRRSMDRTDERYGAYVSILEEELIAAMGCTEPIAIALAAARARELLGVEPARVQVAASGSIIKNAKSVVVPHTGGLKGIEAAAAAGIVAVQGVPSRDLLIWVAMLLVQSLPYLAALVMALLSSLPKPREELAGGAEQIGG